MRPSPRGRAIVLRVFAAVGVGLVILAAAAFGYRELGFRHNLSPSSPPGLYRIHSGPLSRGSYAVVCSPPHARALVDPYLAPGIACPGFRQDLIKTLAAVPGDLVTLTAEGVSVNGGAPIPHSAPRATDSAGRPLPSYRWSGALPPDHYWLGSITPTALDSRYFGPVHRDHIIGPATLLRRF